MTLQEAIERVKKLYDVANKSEKIKQDPLAWALHQVADEQSRQVKEAGDDKGKAAEKGR